MTQMNVQHLARIIQMQLVLRMALLRQIEFPKSSEWKEIAQQEFCCHNDRNAQIIAGKLGEN